MTKTIPATILVIDDDPAVRKTLTACLKTENHTVLEAEDGTGGLALCKRQQPDVVLLDLRMPDSELDGLEVLATLVAEEPEMPVIIISGQATMEDVIEALKLGAWDYLSKPLGEPAVLLHAVNRALERAALQRENRAYREHLEELVRKRTRQLENRNRELEEVSSRLKKALYRQEEAEKTVNRERAFLQELIDGVVDPVKVIDLDYRLLLLNKAARLLLPAGYELTGDDLCYRVFHGSETPCSGEETPCALRKVRRDGEAVSLRHRRRQPDGTTQICEIEASPLWHDDGRLRGIIEVSRNVTGHRHIEEKLKEHESKLHHLAHHDPLTNLPNRLLFHDRLQRAMVKAQRVEQQVALLFLDLDRFKKINETLGHEVGDMLLSETAGRLLDSVRKSDTVARLSGDEFAIILDDIKDIKNAAVIAQKIMHRLEEPFTINSYELVVTCSVGVSIYPNDGRSVEVLMKCTDTAMYRAKEKGRNQYQFYTADMNTRAFELLLLENGLRKALDQDELVVFYQPQFDLRTGGLLGMEALLRWKDPLRGMIPPADFIPLAEETGLIGPIGEWVLHHACSQNKAWQQAGLPPIRVAINISARQFRQQNIPRLVAQILHQTGLKPEYLELELTESIIMHNAEATIATLEELNTMGVRLSIDDFGTGYSSLSYLKLFPIHTLKIDKSFVMNVTVDDNDAMIATSVIALAHSMNLKVIAEGVENEDQLNFLRRHGCDQVQGFLFGRPRPAREVNHHFHREPACLI